MREKSHLISVIMPLNNEFIERAWLLFLFDSTFFTPVVNNANNGTRSLNFRCVNLGIKDEKFNFSYFLKLKPSIENTKLFNNMHLNPFFALTWMMLVNDGRPFIIVVKVIQFLHWKPCEYFSLCCAINSSDSFTYDQHDHCTKCIW